MAAEASISVSAGLSLARGYKYVFFVPLSFPSTRCRTRPMAKACRPFSGSGFSPVSVDGSIRSRRMVGGPAVHFAAVKPVVHSFAPPCSPSPALSPLPISVSLALIRSTYLILRIGRTWMAIGSVSVLLFRPSRGRKPRSLMMSADVGGVQCHCWCWSDITKYRNKMGII